MPDLRVLAFHAGYACRHSGACCSAGWRIPLDAPRARALEHAVQERRLPQTAALTETRDGLEVLRLADDGTCTAFEPATERRPSMCGIHRVLGHHALPAACRHFPRVCLWDPRGVSITLSHFCPTAAALLFEDRPVRVVDAPPGFSDIEDHEGLDAREALPPLLAPGMLMEMQDYAAWETWALSVLDDPARTPEKALAVLRAGADRCRTWKPKDGPLRARVEELPRFADPDIVGTADHALAFARVLAGVPQGLEHPAAPADLDRVHRELVEGGWARWAGPLRRYLAARLHASWVPYQGRGLRTLVESLSASLSVVRVEAARQCARAGRPLDRALLLEAIRQADLLLVHEADAQSLADQWSAVES